MNLEAWEQFIKKHKHSHDPALKRMVARYVKRCRYMRRYLRRGSRQRVQR